MKGMKILHTTKSNIFVAVKDAIIGFENSGGEKDSVKSSFCEYRLTEGVNQSVVAIEASHGSALYLFAAYSNKWICCWDVKSGELLGKSQLKKRTTVLTYGELLTDNPGEESKKVLLSADKFGEVFGVDIPSMLKSPVLCLGHSTSLIIDMMLTPTQQLITCDRDDKIRIHMFPNTLEIISYCLGHSGCVTSITNLSEGFIVSLGWDHKMFIWNYLESKIVGEYNFKDSSDFIQITGVEEGVPTEALENDEVDGNDVEEDNGFDDSNAGSYPLKILNIHSNGTSHKVAVIFKGLSIVNIYNIKFNDLLECQVSHELTVQLLDIPSDMSTLKENKLLFILPKPFYAQIIDVCSTSSDVSEYNEFLSQFKEYCTTQEADFVQQLISADNQDFEQGIRKHVVNVPFDRSQIGTSSRFVGSKRKRPTK